MPTFCRRDRVVPSRTREHGAQRIALVLTEKPEGEFPMSAAAGAVGPTGLADLQSRTDYEAWLLEAVYDITDMRIAVENVDELIYPPSGAPPTQTIFASGSIDIGDWRPGFLKAAAPLVLVSAFKLLDMLLEWVLEQNGQPPTFRFSQKTKALKGAVQFPTLISTRPWLQDRLVALYEQLDPLRGTIIHDRHFSSTDGGLEVASTRGGAPGPMVRFSADDLRNLAVALVSLLRYLEGAWTMDEFREKRLRYTFDQLCHLHGRSSLGQLRPGFLNVRVYVPAGDVIECDSSRVRDGVAWKRPNEDAMFDLRVVAVAEDASAATAYLIPWSSLQDPSPTLRIWVVDLQPYAVELPEGLDLKQLAAEIASRGAVAP